MFTMVDDYRVGYLLARSMSSSEVRMTPRPAKTPAWSVTPLMSSCLDDPSSCSDNASDNSDKIESMCSGQSKNRKRKMGNSQMYTGSQHDQGMQQKEQVQQNQGCGGFGQAGQCMNGTGNQGGGQAGLWAEAESLAADFDGSLSGLGADLSTSSYDMSEALLALPSLYHHHRNGAAQQPPNPIANGFLKEAGLTPLAAAHLHGGSSVSLPGDFHFEGHSTSPCHVTAGNGNASGVHQNAHHDQINMDFERRFQYVLAAATSIATKVNEETLTYLNQGQPYEIKLKKLGELQNYRGVVFRTVVRLCFHDRRLQFSEREQIAQWEDAHPNDRILQVDLPLSYGVTMVANQPDGPTNMVSFLWEPLKEVGLYIKVNCISTEFTPKKHGGEKGVPFRILIETFAHPDNTRLHAAACQVKVFKLKGADRKHKQDREKIIKKTPGEQAKLQPSYECTEFTDVSLESLDSPPPTMQTHGHHSLLSPTYSSDQPIADSPEHVSHSGGNGSIPSVGCTTMNGSGISGPNSFSAHFSPESVRRWLVRNRFTATKTLWDFSGLDLLRLSKEELIEVCGLAEGLRLYNALHYKITFYMAISNVNDPKPEHGMSMSGEGPADLYHPICLSSPSISELTSLLASLFSNHSPMDALSVERLLLSVGNAGSPRIRVVLTEQLLSTLKDQTAFRALKSGSEVYLEIVE